MRVSTIGAGGPTRTYTLPRGATVAHALVPISRPASNSEPIAVRADLCIDITRLPKRWLHFSHKKATTEDGSLPRTRLRSTDELGCLVSTGRGAMNRPGASDSRWRRCDVPRDPRRTEARSSET